MSDAEPITQLIAGLKRNDPDAIERLWQLYFRRVAGLARATLGSTPTGPADEEDVAQSAFHSFCLRAREDRFSRLGDRRDLWSLLATITFRKALKRIRKESRQPPPALEEVESALSQQPNHEFVVALRDEIGHLMALLDEVARRVGWLLLEGHTNQEIAAMCGFSKAKVERKRKLIRETWQREEPA